MVRRATVLIAVVGLVGLVVVIGLVAAFYSPEGQGSSAERQDTFTDTLPLEPSGAVPLPAEGAYFGTYFPASVPDRKAAILGLESQIGRQLAIDHVYYRWDAPFPTSYDDWTISQGRMLFLSWTSRLSTTGAASWNDIVSGRWDRLIDQRARAIKALGVPVLLGFGHEPSDLIGAPPSRSGDIGGYRNAWRYIRARFDAARVDNVSWVWTLTAFAFESGDSLEFYPGDDVVDWVGVDGYVNIDCDWLSVPWSSWTGLFGSAEEFAEDHNKPLVVAEFGLREDPADPERKGKWLAAAAAEIAGMPHLKAVVSFNSQEECSSYIGSSREAVAGYRSLGESAALSAPPPPTRR